MVIRAFTGTVAGIGAVGVTVEVSVTGGGLGLFLVGAKAWNSQHMLKKNKIDSTRIQDSIKLL